MKTRAGMAALIASCLWLTALAQQAERPATDPPPKEKPSEFYLRYRAAVPNATTMDELLAFWRAQAVSEFKAAPPDQRVDLAAMKRAYTMVAEELKKRTTAEWIEALERADIPVQRMNTIEDILADPHLAATGYFSVREHPSEGRIRTLAAPSEWSESQPEYRRHAPRLGEHTREVLREVGLQDKAIEALIAAGAARAAD